MVLTVIQELMLICDGFDSDSGAKVDLSWFWQWFRSEGWFVMVLIVIQELRLICHGFDSDSGAKVDFVGSEMFYIRKFVL